MALRVWNDVTQNHPGNIHINVSIPKLTQMALERKEAVLTSTGALRVATGKYTGRSPHDKFVVDTPDVRDELWWENNKKISEEAFHNLYSKILDYLKNKDLFVFNGYAGADRENTLPVRIITEFAWQNIFVQNLFIRPSDSGWPMPEEPGFTVLAAPGFKAVPSVDGTHSEAFIIVNFAQKLTIIGGTHYAGEIKKSIFSVMNYLLPKKDILSMHCSANKGANDNVTLFFGLSGTGKTSLSADTDRFLIGDDEHGWSGNGVFNFEGGCYAKTIHLTHENEPEIFNAIKFGTILENVIIDDNTGVEIGRASCRERV
jgi:phosphoenolpyruvate carboxykinase (ATP)